MTPSSSSPPVWQPRTPRRPRPPTRRVRTSRQARIRTIPRPPKTPTQNRTPTGAAVGAAADLVFLDAPIGGAGRDAAEAFTAGELPGIGMVMVDGEVKFGRSRNTPPAARIPEIAA